MALITRLISRPFCAQARAVALPPGRPAPGGAGLESLRHRAFREPAATGGHGGRADPLGPHRHPRLGDRDLRLPAQRQGGGAGAIETDSRRRHRQPRAAREALPERRRAGSHRQAGGERGRLSPQLRLQPAGQRRAHRTAARASGGQDADRRDLEPGLHHPAGRPRADRGAPEDAGPHGHRREAPAPGWAHQDRARGQGGKARDRAEGLERPGRLRRETGDSHLRGWLSGSGRAGIHARGAGDLRGLDHATARSGPGHGSDRQRKDHHALCRVAGHRFRRGQHHHHRGPGGDGSGSVQPGQHPDQDRPHLRQRPPARAAPGPRRDHGRRDPRPRDGAERRAGRADRPPGAVDRSHQ